MNRILLTIICLLTASNSLWAGDVVIKKTREAITFVVDEDLPKPKRDLHRFPDSIGVRAILRDENMPVDDDGTRILAYSFKGDSLVLRGPAVLFEMLRAAYADHRPVVLSPDAVWLIISQGFSRYVNAHAEEMRPLLVNHEGKQDLTIVSQKDLLTEDVDWAALMDDFTMQLSQNTRGDLAKTIIADFSTTGVTERIASQVTLMDVFKQYYNYQVMYIVCGIPYITLTGTPQDWQRVLGKAQQLKVYPGIAPWIEKLEPILKEFVAASEGNPHQKFWQSIVRQKRVGELRGGGCSPDRPTMLDGWFLKLFPDKDGEVLDSIPYDYRYMPSEMVRVSFKYKMVDANGLVLSETPMELWAGFVGIDLNDATQALSPRIGWLVRTSNEEEELVQKFYTADQYYGGIKLENVSEVPLALTQIERIRSLSITFAQGKVTLPEWFYQLAINKLVINGQLSEAQEAKLRSVFGERVSINPPTTPARRQGSSVLETGAGAGDSSGAARRQFGFGPDGLVGIGAW